MKFNNKIKISLVQQKQITTNPDKIKNQPKVKFTCNKTFCKKIISDNKLSKISLPGVSVITCTNRPNYMEKVFSNYLRQSYVSKELVVVLNNNSLNLEEWKARAAQYLNIRVFQLDEQKSLGECLNFAIEKSYFDYIAKFDDDDYYAPAYLETSMPAFIYTDASIVGKCSIYVYFETNHTLVLLSPGHENCYVDSVRGATMLIKKEVFNKLRFQSITLGEDTQFLIDCVQNGIKIYSTNRFDYVNLRRHAKDHTWQLDQASYLKSFHFFNLITHTNNYIPLISS